MADESAAGTFVCAWMVLGHYAFCNFRRAASPDIISERTETGCSICLGDACTAPSATSCRHTFCTECVVAYWDARFQPEGLVLRCPMCRAEVHFLLSCGSWEGNLGEQHERAAGRLRAFNLAHGAAWAAGRGDASWHAALGEAPLLMERLCARLATGPSEFFRTLPGRRLLLACAAALLYILSPWDMVPEALLGPWGLIDDIIILGLLYLYAAHCYRRVLAGDGAEWALHDRAVRLNDRYSDTAWGEPTHWPSTREVKYWLRWQAARVYWSVAPAATSYIWRVKQWWRVRVAWPAARLGRRTAVAAGNLRHQARSWWQQYSAAHRFARVLALKPANVD